MAALRGLLEISRLSRRQVPLQEILQTIASIVGRELGFAVVSINAYRSEADEYEVVAVHGSDEARASQLGRVRPASMIAPLLRHADGAMYRAKAAGGGRLARQWPAQPAVAPGPGREPRDGSGGRDPVCC